MTDRYTKTMLTIIVVCLLALTFIKAEPVIRAQRLLICSGDLNANLHGVTAPSVGGYTIRVTCS